MNYNITTPNAPHNKVINLNDNADIEDSPPIVESVVELQLRC